MAGASTATLRAVAAQVTAMGIRDGDPAVLAALVERRGGAVLAYCERYCAPSMALDATSDAFVRFRATVLAAERPGDLDPEGALLGATRHAAAARAPRPPAEAAGGLNRAFGGRGPTERLPDVPDLLAGRAEGTLAPEDVAALDELLSGSPVARSIASRFEDAEEIYRSSRRRTLPGPIVEQIVTAMVTLNAPPAMPVVESAPPRFFREPDPEPEPTPPPSADPFAMPTPPGFVTQPVEVHDGATVEMDALQTPDVVPVDHEAFEAPAPPEDVAAEAVAADDEPEADAVAAPAEEAPVDEVADDEAPGEEVAAEEATVEEVPVDEEAPVEEVVVEDAAADDEPEVEVLPAEVEAEAVEAEAIVAEEVAAVAAEDRVEAVEAEAEAVDEPLVALEAPEGAHVEREVVDDASDAVAEIAAEQGVDGDLAHVAEELPEGVDPEDVENVASETLDELPVDETVEFDAVAAVAADLAEEGELAHVEPEDEDAPDPHADLEGAHVEPELAPRKRRFWRRGRTLPAGIEPEDVENVASEELPEDLPLDVDDAVPDDAEIAAARGEETVEWEAEAPAAPEAEEDAAPAMPAAPHHHRGIPGRAALAPAGAVVAIAAIGAMVASGVFGGNDPSPPVDTGIVPERALQAVPEGEAATVVDDLRTAAADARRRRLADLRQALAARPIDPTTPPAQTTPTTPTTPAGTGTATTPE